MSERSLTLAELIDDYMRGYAGRDQSRGQRLREWVARLGERPAAELSDDDVFAVLKALAKEPARSYQGKDADGNRVFRAKGKRSPATLNKYHAALGAVFTWAIAERMLPKGFVHPCRGVRRHAEDNGRVRFLSDEERTALLEACRASRWPRLHLLVWLAISTGARKGELLGLRWCDIDRKRNVAMLATSKNGDRRALPLIPHVLAELERFSGAPESLIFHARSRANHPYSIETAWRHAVARAKLRDFKFHDLRHTCASYLAQNGATMLELADVLGHRQMRMVQRYSHLTVDTKARLVARVFEGLA